MNGYLKSRQLTSSDANQSYFDYDQSFPCKLFMQMNWHVVVCLKGLTTLVKSQQQFYIQPFLHLAVQSLL